MTYEDFWKQFTKRLFFPMYVHDE